MNVSIETAIKVGKFCERLSAIRRERVLVLVFALIINFVAAILFNGVALIAFCIVHFFAFKHVLDSGTKETSAIFKEIERLAEENINGEMTIEEKVGVFLLECAEITKKEGTGK
ncbi:MAG: hypothetical protein IJK26_09940 [Clostridia bacterium]|nr:hypothetical protein [Clostridia bacterium]